MSSLYRIGSVIQLRYASIEWTNEGCLTRFEDGVELGSYPHDTPHYAVISHRLGYGDDIKSFCRQHDFFHHFAEQFIHNAPSRTLWDVAHNYPDGRTQGHYVYEELVVQACQRWVRANERPIIEGVEWDRFKAEALELLG
jgi:hypothetical protein